MPSNRPCCEQSNISAQQISFNSLSLQSQVDLLGSLITAIALITEQADSQEFVELKNNTDELESLSEILGIVTEHNKGTMVYNGTDAIQFIKQHADSLKTISISLYKEALEKILKGTDIKSDEESMFQQHPFTRYADFLASFADTQFFPISEDLVTLVTQAFSYCCQKLYTECTILEELISQKKITSIVDCIWYFELLNNNKNEIIYVFGGWRYSRIVAALEELKEQYKDQHLDDLNEQDMLKLVEALTYSITAEQSCCCSEDESDDEDDCCCHQDCCS